MFASKNAGVSYAARRILTIGWERLLCEGRCV